MFCDINVHSTLTLPPGHRACVEWLLAANARHDLLDANGKSAAMLGCTHGHDYLAEMLKNRDLHEFKI